MLSQVHVVCHVSVKIILFKKALKFPRMLFETLEGIVLTFLTHSLVQKTRLSQKQLESHEKKSLVTSCETDSFIQSNMSWRMLQAQYRHLEP